MSLLINDEIENALWESTCRDYEIYKLIDLVVTILTVQIYSRPINKNELQQVDSVDRERDLYNENTVLVALK